MIEGAISKKPYFFAIYLAIILIASPSIISIAAEKPSEKRDINPIIRQIVDYAMPELGNYPVKKSVKSNAVTNGRGRASLGVTSFSPSPGVTIGHTYYDYQHNTTTGRRVGIGHTTSDPDTSP